MKDENKTDSADNDLAVAHSESAFTQKNPVVLSSQPHPSTLKILLWDIDGTLMSSVQNGSFKIYFTTVMKNIFGTCGKLDELQVSGMTDFQIFYESLKDEGFTVESIRAKLPELLEVFPVEMNRVVDGENTHKLMGGIREILQATAENPRFINALLTGNLTPAARIKIGIFRLEKYFDFSISAFGENSHERNDLGFIAMQKANKKFGYAFQPSQFIIIGDTPKDIYCARACGAKVIAVATGRSHPGETLLEYKPDVLLKNLEKTEEVLRAIETL